MKEKTYTICARLNIEVTTEVKANSYEEAAIEAKQLRASDFVSIPVGAWQDGGIEKILFISEND